MHILVLPSAYPTEDAPIRSMFFKEQALGLKKASNNVGVVYNETRRITGVNINTLKKFHFQTVDVNEEGINTIRLKGWSVLLMRNSLGIGLWIRQSVNLIEKYIKKYGKPDIIHVHCGLYAGSVAEIIKGRYNIPYVITEHSSQVLNKKMDAYHEGLLKSAYDNADALISVGEKLKQSMESYTKNSITVVPNIVNTSNFNIKEIIKDKFVFVSVSNLKKSKNVDLTIKAFAKNFKDNKNVILQIAGEGEEMAPLKELSRELGVEDQVIFHGRVERKDMPSLLQNSDCFVLPSQFETFGVAYIEALACGLPIITTKCGGPEDFYREDLGCMIEVGDEEALRKSMIYVMNNIENYDKKELSNYVKNKFSEGIVVNQIIKVFNNLI